MSDSSPENMSASHEATPLRVALMGVFASRLRFGSVLNQVSSLEVTAIVDPDQRVTRTWIRQIRSKATVYSDFAEFLPTLSEIDAVCLTVPLVLRNMYLETLLEHEVALLCEVPFGYSVAASRAIVQKAREKRGLLMPIFPRRFDPYFHKVKEVLESGVLGTLKQVRCEWSFPIADAVSLENGVDDFDEDQILQYALCQSADLCRYWFGEPFSVSADITALRPENRVLTQRAKKSEGTLATLIVSHENAQVTHTVSRVRAAYPGERYIFTGAHGQLELLARSGTHHATFAAPCLIHHAGGRSETIFVDTEGVPAEEFRMQRLLQHFVDCATSPKAPLLLPEEASLSLELVHASYTSTIENSKVPLPLHRATSFETFFRRFETVRHLAE